MQEADFGFDPDELELAHLDQTQAKGYVPLPHQAQEPGPSHAGPEKLSSQPHRTVPQQLTHLGQSRKSSDG